jgi:hypothetical protein
VLKLVESFAAADFPDRLDMLTMPAIGMALFLEWSWLRPGTQPGLSSINARDFYRTRRILNATANVATEARNRLDNPLVRILPACLSPLEFPAISVVRLRADFSSLKIAEFFWNAAGDFRRSAFSNYSNGDLPLRSD